MNKLAIIENGTVINVIKAEPSFDPNGIVVDDTVAIGDSYNALNKLFIQKSPAVTPIKYQTRFRADVFKADVLSPIEFDSLLDWDEALPADKTAWTATEKSVHNAIRRLVNRNGWVDVEDPETIALANFSLSVGIVSSEARKNEILLGLPIA